MLGKLPWVGFAFPSGGGGDYSRIFAYRGEPCRDRTTTQAESPLRAPGPRATRPKSATNQLRLRQARRGSRSGIAIIFSNYLEFLPASPDNYWLLGGLGAVLAGIITATQWR